MIKSLTSIRFLFAAMVFSSHLTFLKSGDESFSNWIFEKVFSEGALGVSFFFVLSGFILTYRYHDKFANRQQSKTSFYIGRISRIYPLHLLCFVISIPLVIHQFDGNIIKLLFKGIFNLTLTQSFIPIQSVYFSFNMPSWSLSDEVFFYLLFPFLINLIKPNQLLKNTVIAVSLTILTLSLLLYIPQDWHHQLFYINPLARLYDFVMGIITFGFYKHIKATEIYLGTWFEVGAISTFIILFAFHNQASAIIVNSLYYIIPICLIILSISLEQGKISKFLQQKHLVILGEISFAFYMIHQLVIRYYLQLTTEPLLRYHAIDSVILFLISVGLSYFIYHYIEINAKNAIRNFYTKKS